MSRAPIEIVPVTTRAEMDAFIRLPYRLHEGDPTWVPPLLMERREALDPAKNPFLRRASVRYWLARRDGRVVGRISAQMDPFVAKLRGPGEGHFGMIAAEDDPGVFAEQARRAHARSHRGNQLGRVTMIVLQPGVSSRG